MSKRLHRFTVLISSCITVLGCGGETQPSAPRDPVAPVAHAADDSPAGEHGRARVDSRPPPMHEPVPLYEGGATEREIDAATAAEDGYVVLDLGDDWTPYLFTDGVDEDGTPLPHRYRPTYLALARGEFPGDHHGDRARSDKYLELFGIMPTLTLVRERFEETAGRACAEELDYEPLVAFEDTAVYVSNDRARRDARRFAVAKRRVEAMVRQQGAPSEDALDEDALDDRDKGFLRTYRRLGPAYRAIVATQARLRCEGYLDGRQRVTRGGMDWVTHEALAEFERRHRIYSWGYIGRDTSEFLRMTPVATEREAVLRVLTERAMHAAGVIEDGSRSEDGDGNPITFVGADGQPHPVPNLEAELRERIIEAFGLQTPESTLAWLRSLDSLEGHRQVAFASPELPEYYGPDMDLSVEVYRGDVWYEFPFDDEGRERAQPVARRPRLTIFTRYRGQKIALARIGTTIGGWRSDNVDGTIMWRYKGSPTGPRVWHQIVSAPVWLPPESTPPRALLSRSTQRGGPRYVVDYHETGPSYASAYGLVAAYHREYRRMEDGEIRIGGDEGIRTHGSVDYMSIMRRHSHGCHRLHNHMAIRLMSFVLAHRPHVRKGHDPLSFMRDFEYEDEAYHMEITRGGYVFDLLRPVPVNVLEGRIRGRLRNPIEHPIPKFDQEVGAYVLPDGGAVSVDRFGAMQPIPFPVPDGGVPLDGSMAAPSAPAVATAAGATPATPGSAPGNAAPTSEGARVTPSVPRPASTNPATSANPVPAP